MTEDHTEDVRALVRALCADTTPVTVWDNPLGGRTLRLDGDGSVRYLKVAPTTLPDSHAPIARPSGWSGPAICCRCRRCRRPDGTMV